MEPSRQRSYSRLLGFSALSRPAVGGLLAFSSGVIVSLFVLPRFLNCDWVSRDPGPSLSTASRFDPEAHRDASRLPSDVARAAEDSGPLDSVCGAWREAYARDHSKMLEAAKEASTRESRPDQAADESSAKGEGIQPRFITYAGESEAVSGLADTLLGLVSTFMAALMEARGIIITHPTILSAFEPAQVDWTPTSAVPLQPSRVVDPADAVTRPWKHRDTQTANMSDPPVLGATPGEVVKLDWLNGYDAKYYKRLPAFFRDLGNASNIVVQWNRARMVQVLTDPKHGWHARMDSLGLRLPYAFGCIIRFLLRPKAEVEERIRGVTQRLFNHGGVCIGVHVRMPDDVSWGTQGEKGKEGNGSLVTQKDLKRAKEFFDCAQALEHWYFPAPVPVKWLLLSSSWALKSALRDMYPEKVVVTDIAPEHLQYSWNDQNGTSSASLDIVAEWLLYSRCQKFVFGKSTGYPKTAAMYAMRPLSMFLDTGCNPQRPVTIETLGMEYSGLR